MNERIKRRRSSSRCSKNDICPPSSSSFPRLVDKAFIIADIGSDRRLEPFLFSKRLSFCWRRFWGSFYKVRGRFSDRFRSSFDWGLACYYLIGSHDYGFFRGGHRLVGLLALGFKHCFVVQTRAFQSYFALPRA